MSLPDPEVGLVIAYSYLWHCEHQAGQEEGRKDRPGVIVLAVERPSDGVTFDTVLPITHSMPTAASTAIEIPAALKRHLGLDNARSWIVVAEGNEFVWPGHDLRKVPTTGRYEYGFLPPRFVAQVQAAFVACNRQGQSSLTPRT